MNVGTEDEKLAQISNPKFAKKFGQSPIFVASTQLLDGETLKHGNLASQLTEAIHVISCGYEEKTEWGKEVTKPFHYCDILRCCAWTNFYISTFEKKIRKKEKKTNFSIEQN